MGKEEMKKVVEIGSFVKKKKQLNKNVSKLHYKFNHYH